MVILFVITHSNVSILHWTSVYNTNLYIKYINKQIKINFNIALSSTLILKRYILSQLAIQLTLMFYKHLSPSGSTSLQQIFAIVSRDSGQPSYLFRYLSAERRTRLSRRHSRSITASASSLCKLLL